MPHNILISGGTGLVGSELIPALQQIGHKISLLSRSKGDGNDSVFQWDHKEGFIQKGAFDGVNTLVHLAGAGVADKRWTAERKKEIIESRTLSSNLLFETLKRQPNQVKTLVAASAIGYYGMDTGDQLMTEESPAGNDFLSQVVKEWEASTKQFESLGIRVVQIRIGVVLAKEGGALPKILQPPVAAPLASGDQYMSWIHMDDLVGIIVKAIADQKMTGVFNAVAPMPENNRDFTKLAAKAFGKLYLPIPVPGFLLGLILGEMAQIVTGGNKVSAQKIENSGYKFQFFELEKALMNLAKRK
uniref:TIGR01777 family oxidoreductase n=2 Tax=Roseivirga sp. TaxID=1964215 RepID=UPI004047E76D